MINITMNTVNLYISTCRCIMLANSSSHEAVAEVGRLLHYLRQCLSCCVCTGVLNVPMGPVDSVCRHHVCRDCIGGRMRLKPACSWCKDYNQFVENTQLRVLVQCFKKLCQYLTTSAVARSLNENTNNGGTNNLLLIIQEGTQISDDYEHHTNVAPLPVFPSVPKQPNVSPTIKRQGRPPGSKNRRRGFAGAGTPRRSSETEQGSPAGLSTQHVTQEHDYINTRDSLNDSFSESSCDEPRVKLTKLPDSWDSRDSHSSHGSPRQKEPRAEAHGSPRQRELRPDSQTSPRQKDLRPEQVSPREKDSRLSESHGSPRQKDSRLLESHGSPRQKDSRLSESHSSPRQKDSCSRLSESHGSGRQTKPEGAVTQGSRQKEGSNAASTVTGSVKRGRKPKSKIGCRCGLATPTPGKLTCCGQRCPCYSSFKGCIPECRCRGCRNPRKVPQDSPLLTTTAVEEDCESDIEVDI